MNVLDYADLYAERAHKDQKRKYNHMPYIVHPRRVAAQMAKFTTNQAVLAATLLHDVIEDCNVTFDTLRHDFGETVAAIVQALTNTSKATHPASNRAQRKAIDRQRLAEVPECIRGSVHTIKVLDRLDNLRDIPASENDFFRVYLKESRDLLDVLVEAEPVLREELANLINILEAQCQQTHTS